MPALIYHPTFADRLAIAKQFDAQDLLIKASEAYEGLIATGKADIDIYVDLAVLYFVCTDYGYSTYHALPRWFIEKSWKRAHEVLNEATIVFGNEPEFLFWHKYFDFVVLGDSPFDDECQQWVARSNTLVPYFYLFSVVDTDKYKEQATKLFELVKYGHTAKERYIKSILEPHLKVKRT